MRIRTALRALPALIGLVVLALVPAARAAETLVLSCKICSQLVVTAHSTFNAPCKNGKMMPMEHMGGMEKDLAFTGSHTPQLLAVGLGLLAIRGPPPGRRRPRPA